MISDFLHNGIQISPSFKTTPCQVFESKYLIGYDVSKKLPKQWSE